MTDISNADEPNSSPVTVTDSDRFFYGGLAIPTPELLKQEEKLQTREERLAEVVRFGLPAVIAGGADTIAQSVGLADDDDLTSFLRDVAPGLGDYYRNNRQVSQTIGDVTTMFIPGMAATKLIRSGSFVHKLATAGKKESLLNSVFTSGATRDHLLRAVRLQDYHLARQGVKDLASNDLRRRLANRALTQRVGDNIKETLAFEAGVLATMNESDVLYPDQFSFVEHLALNGFFPAAIAGAEALRMRRLIRQSAQSVGLERIAEAANDPQNLQASRLISRPGARDHALTVNGIYLSWIEREIAETSGLNETRLQVLNQLRNETEGQINQLIKNLGKDNNIGTNPKSVRRLVESSPVLNSTTISDAEVNTIKTALKRNNFALSGTVSLENLKPVFKENLKMYEAQKKQVAKLGQEIAEKINKKNELKADGFEGSKEYEDIIAELDHLQSQRELIDSLELYVIEPTGEINLAKMRKPVFEDLPDWNNRLRDRNATALEPARTDIDIPRDELYGVPEAKASFTAEGHLIIPKQAKDRIINNVNVTQVVSPIEAQSQEHTRLLLRDIGKDWHFKRGRGKEIFNTLSKEIQTEVENWTGSSGSSAIRQWFADGDNRAAELYNAYAPIRARLAELADQDGTIPLLRGESLQETKKPTNDVVSMTSNPDVARKFASGDNIISRRVPIEDIVMVVGGLGDEWEFIVKGNLSRNTGEQVSQRGIEQFGLLPRTAFYAAARKQIEKFNPAKTKIFVTQSDHHTRLDYVLALYEKYGDGLGDSVVLPKGIDNLDELEFRSLASKYKEYVNYRKLKEATTGSDALIKISEDQLINEVDLIKSLNLPGTADGGQHPVITMFEAAYLQGDEVLEDYIRNMDHLKAAMEQELRFGSELGISEGAFRYRGHMFDVDMFKNNRAVNAIKRPVQDDDFLTEAVVNKAIQQRQFIDTYFGTADQFGADLVKLIYDDMTTGSLADATAVARQVDTIHEGAQRGRGAVTSQAHAVGETPAMIAFHDIEWATTRQAEEYIGQQYKQFESTFQRIRSPQFKGDREAFIQYVDARRVGWDVEPAPVMTDDGKFAFKLTNKHFNQTKFKEIFGREMREDELMPSIVNTNEPVPVVLTELGLETADAYATLGRTALRNSNHIRRTLGQSAINERNWWVPPRNLARQETNFIVDSSGHLVDIVPGRTAKEAQIRAEEEIVALQKKNPDGGFFIANQRDIATYFSLQDEAFERMIDYSDPLAQTGKARRNVATQTVDVGMQVLDDMNASINKQFQSIPRRVRATMFEGEINYLRNRYNNAPLEATRSGTNIWQQAIAAIHGNQTINPNQNIGRIYNTVESVYDETLNRVFDKVRERVRPQGSKTVTRHDVKSFEALDKTLGEYNPFKSAADFAANTHQISLPPRMKQHAAALNNFTAFMALRLLDAGHAMLNVAGSLSTYAPIVRSLKPLPDETLEMWQARVGAYATAMPEQGLAMFNPSRAMADIGHWWFTDDGRRIIQKAAERGEFKQDVAELVLTAGANHDTLVSGFVKRNTKYLTMLADKSEEFSRAIGWSLGYRIATRGLGMGEDQAFTMARRVANMMVGDYRPNNRPRVFQGAAGMPLGLFTTYMWNFYQRLFGYIENGQTRALVTQFATQASVFGGSSVPGFDQFVQFFASNYDGTQSLPDGLQNRFGSATADWFLYGAVSNIPKMFGADDGIAFMSRGDLNMHRIPFLPSKPTDVPSIKAVADTTALIGKTAEMMMQQGGFSRQQMLEIIGNYSVSRPARMLAYMGAGAVTDRRGQTINNDVFTGMSIAARLMGMRPLNEAKRMEAHAAARYTDLQQRSRMIRLRDAVRANIRENKGSLTKEQLDDAVNSYFKYGGNPQYFSRFLTEQILTSTVDRDSRELLRALRDPQRGADVQRFLNANTPTEFLSEQE